MEIRFSEASEPEPRAGSSCCASRETDPQAPPTPRPSVAEGEAAPQLRPTPPTRQLAKSTSSPQSAHLSLLPSVPRRLSPISPSVTSVHQSHQSHQSHPSHQLPRPPPRQGPQRRRLPRRSGAEHAGLAPKVDRCPDPRSPAAVPCGRSSTWRSRPAAAAPGTRAGRDSRSGTRRFTVRWGGVPVEAAKALRLLGEAGDRKVEPVRRRRAAPPTRGSPTSRRGAVLEGVIAFVGLRGPAWTSSPRAGHLPAREAPPSRPAHRRNLSGPTRSSGSLRLKAQGLLEEPASAASPVSALGSPAPL
jgi:hypothetical protein